MKLMFLDTETTGTDPQKHGIHQISGKIVIDGVTMETFDFKVKPRSNALIVQKALEVCGVTFEQINEYPDQFIVKDQFMNMVLKYIDPNDEYDKFIFVGFNFQKFDVDMMFQWFFKMGAKDFFLANFYPVSYDVMVLAMWYVGDKRRELSNFKQGTVAVYLGIDVDPSKLHEGGYDVEILHKIYNIVSPKY